MWGSKVFVSEKTGLLSFPVLTPLGLFFFLLILVSLKSPAGKKKGSSFRISTRIFWWKACLQDTDVTECGLEVCACRCSGSVGINPKTLWLQRAQAFEDGTLRRVCEGKVLTCHFSKRDRNFWQTGEKCKCEVFQGNEILLWTWDLFPFSLPIGLPGLSRGFLGVLSNLAGEQPWQSLWLQSLHCFVPRR